jgi:hypothetical protein
LLQKRHRAAQAQATWQRKLPSPAGPLSSVFPITASMRSLSIVRGALSAAVDQAYRTTDLSARTAALDVAPLGTTPEQMAELIRQSTARWVPLIEAAKISITSAWFRRSYPFCSITSGRIS